ncbi:MAG: hypothetical protein H6Q15_171 [Bacteroidetes bacterium]|nr:hypothetical protein [Bacteroidota bacterium]
MEKITAQEFWQWFQDHSEHLMDIDNIDPFEADELMKEFEKTLALYSEGMSFEMSDLTEKGREIVFSAEGDEDYFDDVIALVENTPVLDFWEINAFKQPKGPNVKIKFENYVYASKNLWFLPLENEEFEETIGLMVGVPDFKENDEDQEIAVYTLIETMIGEYDCTTLLEYFEICQLPEDPEAEGFTNLTNLPEYIDWHLNNIQGKD